MEIAYLISSILYLAALIVICISNGKMHRKILDLQDKLSEVAIDYVKAQRKLNFYKSVVDELEKEKIKNKTNDETN